MVSPTTRIDVGGAAELTHHQNDGRLEQSSFLEINQQCGEGPVQGGNELFLHVVVVPVMGVPIVLGFLVPAVDGHETTSRFHQAAGQQGPLSESSGPVGLLDLFRFLGEIEGVADRR